MKRQELARQLASRRHISNAEARDQLDQVVHRILTSLRQGQTAELQGVGQLKAEPKPAAVGKKSKP